MIEWAKETTQEEKDKILRVFHNKPKIHERAIQLQAVYGQCFIMMMKDGTFRVSYVDYNGFLIEEVF